MQQTFKYFFSLLILLTAIISAEELPIGSNLPLADNEMQEISGNTITLKGAMGESGLIVIFSCNTCPWVKAWNDRYVSITKKYQPLGVNVVALNSNEASRAGDESLSAMRKFAKKNDYNFSYAVDKNSELAYAFGASRTPHVYLFNAEGVLVYRGAIDDNSRNAKAVKEPFLATAIDQLLAGEEISTASSKALGCAIKFASK